MAFDSSAHAAQLEFLRKHNPELADNFEAALALATSSPRLSAVSARICVEFMLRIFAKNSGAPAQGKREDLVNYIEKLHAEHSLPLAQKVLCHRIRELGGTGAHADEKKKVSTADAQRALSLLGKLADWLRIEVGDVPSSEVRPDDPIGHDVEADKRRIEAEQEGQRIQNEIDRRRREKAAEDARLEAERVQGLREAEAEREKQRVRNEIQQQQQRIKAEDEARKQSERVKKQRETDRARKRALVSATVIGGVLILGWGVFHFATGASATNPPYPITNFAGPQKEQVTSTKLNVRGGPGASYPTLKQALQGDQLTGFGTAPSSDGGVWQYVQLADGSYGYVNSKLVGPLVAAVVAPAVTAAAPADAATAVEAAPPPPAPAPVSVPQPAEAVDETARAQQIITSSNFYRDQSPDSGEVPGRSMVLRVDASYANARPGDMAQGAMALNGQIISRCNPIALQTGGSFWCRIPIYTPGNYVFALAVNGVQVASHEFDIPGQSQAAQPVYNAPQQYGQAQPMVTPGMVRQVIGAVTAQARNAREQSQRRSPNRHW